MSLSMSRRDCLSFLAASGVAATLPQLQRGAAIAAPSSPYRAMVGIFLLGGNDGWNMIVPMDLARYSGYASARRASLVLPQSNLVPLAPSSFGLHPRLKPLKAIWDDGAMNIVLNTGTLHQPLTKAEYLESGSRRPTGLMSHSDEQAHWQGLRARDSNPDGFMGRLTDRMAPSAISSLISFGGGSLAMVGRSSAPLVLPSRGINSPAGYSGSLADPVVFARSAALSAFASGAGLGTLTTETASSMSSTYAQISTANSILSSMSTVDKYFVSTTTGAPLTSDISCQLLRIARMIEARGTLGHTRQTFFANQGGYDTHAAQTGTQAALFNDLSESVLAFYRAVVAMGVVQNVTAFTMSDFGRSYKGNAQDGTDHAWGNNQLVIGGSLLPKQIHGMYPSQVMGGFDDVVGDGRFIPTISQEQYLGGIARWHGVLESDMPYVFPNWSNWIGEGRSAIPLFQV
jgi:uncharacterized protein (DUF1501 family)